MQASASSPAPSTDPRSRRSGQLCSCTPATTTTSHSRPLDRCAVRTRTQSSRTARSASVSPTISCPARLSANRPGEPGGMVSAKCAALSNRASTASRSRSAAAPAGAARRGGLLPLRGQPRRIPDGPEHVLGVAAGLDRGLGHREQPGHLPGRARPRCPAARPGPAGSAGPRRAGRRRPGPGPPPPRPAARGTGAGGAGPGHRCRRAGRRAARPRSARRAWPAAARSGAA